LLSKEKSIFIFISVVYVTNILSTLIYIFNIAWQHLSVALHFSFCRIGMGGDHPTLTEDVLCAIHCNSSFLSIATPGIILAPLSFLHI
jgi:hypothetical protein